MEQIVDKVMKTIMFHNILEMLHIVVKWNKIFIWSRKDIYVSQNYGNSAHFSTVL